MFRFIQLPMKLIFMILASILTANQLAADPLVLEVPDQVLRIEIRGPMAELIKSAKDFKNEPSFPFHVFDQNGVKIADASIKVRGNSSRECSLPKFKIKIQNDIKGLFGIYKNLRINNPCGHENSIVVGDEQGVFLEKTVYEILKVFESKDIPAWKHRLAQIKYVEEQNGQVVYQTHALLVEDTGTLAKRYGGKEYKSDELDIFDFLEKFPVIPDSKTFLHTFNSMIHHIDYSIPSIQGAGLGTLWSNVEAILQSDPSRSLWIPYDFDRTLLTSVKLDLKASHEQLPIYPDFFAEKSPQEKLFIFALFDIESSHSKKSVETIKKLFIEKKAQVIATVRKQILLTTQHRARVEQQLSEFYKILESNILHDYLILPPDLRSGFADENLQKTGCRLLTTALVKKIKTSADKKSILVRTVIGSIQSTGNTCENAEGGDTREFWVPAP